MLLPHACICCRHQKLHNNTSPDDVVICQALIAMLEEGLDIRAY